MAGIHAERMIRALGRLGWTVQRSRKHFILSNAAGKTLTVPMHPGTTLKEGTARAILKHAGVSEDAFFDEY